MHDGKFIHVDPYNRTPMVMHITGSVFWDIWPGVLLFTIIGAAVCAINQYSSVNLGIDDTMITVLGTSLGFVISYRTSSAYEKYWEGRVQWSSVVRNSRTFSKLIWFHVPPYLHPPADPRDAVPENERTQVLVEKITLIRLIEAYAFALKHYLRGEYGPYYEDLYHLVCYLPKYALPAGAPDVRFQYSPSESSASSSSSISENNDNIEAERRRRRQQTADSSNTDLEKDGANAIVQSTSQLNVPYNVGSTISRNSTLPVPESSRMPIRGPHDPPVALMPSRNPPPFNFVDDAFPFLSPFRTGWRWFVKRYYRMYPEKYKEKARPPEPDSIPLEIIYYFSAWVGTLQQRKVLDVPTTNALMAAILTFQSGLTNLEQILGTPIPFAYSIHLRHSAWVYLFFLPFQMQPTLHWVTVPAMAIAAFIFLGFLAIGQEIEQPFGYDSNDMDMDMFCHKVIAKELDAMIANPPPTPSHFIFLDANLPLGVNDGRSARELLNSNVSAYEIQTILNQGHEKHKGWKTGLGSSANIKSTQQQSEAQAPAQTQTSQSQGE